MSGRDSKFVLDPDLDQSLEDRIKVEMVIDEDSSISEEYQARMKNFVFEIKSLTATEVSIKVNFAYPEDFVEG